MPIREAAVSLPYTKCRHRNQNYYPVYFKNGTEAKIVDDLNNRKLTDTVKPSLVLAVFPRKVLSFVRRKLKHFQALCINDLTLLVQLFRRSLKRHTQRTYSVSLAFEECSLESF